MPRFLSVVLMLLASATAIADPALMQQFLRPSGAPATVMREGDIVRLLVRLEPVSTTPEYSMRRVIHLPPHLELLDATSTPASAAMPDIDGRIDWNLAGVGLSAGTAATLDLLLRVSDGAAGQTLTSIVSDTDGRDGTILSAADLKVMTQASVDLDGDISVFERRPGNTIEVVFTISVTNHGPEPATDVVLVLDLDQGLIDEIEDTSRFEPEAGVVCDEDVLACAFGDLDVGETRSVDAVLVFLPGDGDFAMTMAGTFSSLDTDVDTSNNYVNLSYGLQRGHDRDDDGGGGSSGWWLIGLLGLAWLALIWRRR